MALVQLWSRLRTDLVTELTRIRNRLHALLLLCDPEYKLQVPALTTTAGIQACRQYTAPGRGRLARERKQADQLLADQLALLTEHERVLRRKREAAIADHFAPLIMMDGVGPIIAAGLIAE